MTKPYQNYVNGKVGAVRLREKLSPAINPARKKECVGEFQASVEDDAGNAVSAAQSAFKDWKKKKAPGEDRMVEKFISALESHNKEFAGNNNQGAGEDFKGIPWRD